MDFFGGGIARAIEGHQIMALEKDERFESVAALELAKDAGEGRTESLRVDGVEDGAHLGVRGDMFEAEDSFEVELVATALLIERQERGRFESEDGVARHEGVMQRDFSRCGTLLGNLVKNGTHEAIESVGGQMLAFLRVEIHGKSLCVRQFGEARGL